MLWRLATVAAFAVFALVAAEPTVSAENPWEDLMGPGDPHPWSDPSGRFSLDLPVGWSGGVRKSAESFVDFWRAQSDFGQNAHVSVEVRALPPGVSVAHVATRLEEESRARLRGYELFSRERREVAGVPAIRRHFAHRLRGNAELPTEVVEVVLVSGSRAFVVTLETAHGARELFREEFEKMLRTFVARSPSETVASPSKKRMRVKSGEMVNPDAVQY